jgi:hypothetical protein
MVNNLVLLLTFWYTQWYDIFPPLIIYGIIYTCTLFLFYLMNINGHFLLLM